MILKQEQIIPILSELFQDAWHNHKQNLPLEHSNFNTTKLLLFQRNCEELATITSDIQILLHLPVKTTYYFNWKITIQENQLPSIELSIKIITPKSHNSISISPQLTGLFTTYFIKNGRIPNPWLIS